MFSIRIVPLYTACGAAWDGTKATLPRGSRAARLAQLAATTAIASLVAATPSLAGPTGGSVVAGQASIQQSGSTTNINQSTNSAIINWQGFSIGRQETVNFNQPSAMSVTLNRVIGNETSVISGALNANGKVFIVNSNGVLFTKGSQVNVGGLVASTLDISNADFMAGRYTFSGSSNAAVVNKGHLHASPGGEIALLGHTVKNDGVIVANLGTVAMASGSQITLNYGGNSLVDVTISKGALKALVENKRAIIANGGRVIMTAKAADQTLSAVVSNTGLIQANTMAALKGGGNGSGQGQVHVGKIKLIAYGGNVNAGGKISASARGSANAGSITVLAKGGMATVTGTLEATAQNGNGGTIETSGSKVTIADTAFISTKSASGQTGTWTVDPDGFTIATTLSASGYGDITGAQLSAELANNNVTISSTQGAGNYGANGGDGNINVLDTVSWTSGNTLTLTATNAININYVTDAQGTVTATGAFHAPSGGLVLNAGTDINVMVTSSLQVASLNATAVG